MNLFISIPQRIQNEPVTVDGFGSKVYKNTVPCFHAEMKVDILSVQLLDEEMFRVDFTVVDGMPTDLKYTQLTTEEIKQIL